tara:strand:+ start:507 stop:1544 length:1038 start_codon:yes stop_codon:yes gene_type:complete
MSNILILGAGSMGTAFSLPCSENKHSVVIVGSHLEDEFINNINKTRIHPALSCHVPKNIKFVKFKNLKEECNKKVDLIVVAIISKAIEWASIELSKVITNKTPILLLTKGLSVNKGKYEVLAHKMERLLKTNGNKESNISAAGGPCLAKGLANKIHTSVIFANKDINVVNQIAKLVSTNYYHISTTTDVIGVEVCAAIKNIYSMCIGASIGLCNVNLSSDIREKNYLNTAASILQQSINEMVFFTEKLNGKKETVMGLAGIGDLYVSADGGRNSEMGFYLGQGMSYKDAKLKKMSSITVEGADLAVEIRELTKKTFDSKTVPLMYALIDTICESKPLVFEWKNFK